MKILFITWDGPQTYYLEGLFLPIFQALALNGLQFHILQFTWGDEKRAQARRLACIEAGFTCEIQRVWRHHIQLGSLMGALRCARMVRHAIRDHRIDVVMPRSTIPALAALLALRGSEIPMVFDSDGLPLDEKVDFAGMSASGLTYRMLRDVESQAVRRANAVLTRSDKASDVLLSRGGPGTHPDKFHVVGNGRDTRVFRPRDEAVRRAVRTRLGLGAEVPLLIYAGSLGRQYCMPEMLSLFSFVKRARPEAHFLVLTPDASTLQPVIAQFAWLREAVSVLAVPANEVPEYLASADVGIALRQPSFSMLGVAPIKLGEYLLCGLPVVATQGIGDTHAISPDVGLLVEGTNEQDIKDAASWIVDTVLPARETFRQTCREAGMRNFSLESSALSYRTAFSNISS